MSRWILLGSMLAVASFQSSAWGQGMLVPTRTMIPPLPSIVYQRVNVEIKDQAAVTRVEQEFQNHQSHPLEAFYLFPVPKDAGVQDFAMWIDGKRIKGEVVEAKKARDIYTDIVRRMKDPGLLEYMENSLYRVRVFPVPAQGRQKIEISFSQVVPRDGGIAEYVYPLRARNCELKTEKDFTVRVDLQSSAALKSVYSPSHAVGVSREGDHKAIVGFEANQYDLSKDFRLYWTVSEKDVGISVLTHRVSPGEPGYFLALISPSMESTTARVPRDIVFVFDTSGSMQGEKIDQARKSLQFCLKSLAPEDRFAILGFSTTVKAYADQLQSATKENVDKASEWCSRLDANGGTAISDALEAALALRRDEMRNFTVVFLTDGQPTIGESNPVNILAMVKSKNTAQTRIFVFGVGEDVNTHLLDPLADQTRATTVYVASNENLETKVSSFYAKISHPVLTDLAISLGNSEIRLEEIFPPKLPDLFHGGQLVVLGRYQGSGATSIKLTGKLGSESKEFVQEAQFPQEKSENDFLGNLWARRKVGYLLDQIRLSGENKELIDEVIALGKKFGIATPYTSYLVVPDGPVTAQRSSGFRDLAETRWHFGKAMGESTVENAPITSRSFAAGQISPAGTSLTNPMGLNDGLHRRRLVGERAGEGLGRAEVLRQKVGQAAIDVAKALGELKDADSNEPAILQSVGNSRFFDTGGVWIDEAFEGTDKATLITVKYLSDAYFRILELQPTVKDIFALGDRIVWVTPSGKILVIDEKGKESLTDEEIKTLFTK
ncbi:MAG: VIT domain-containing protein [Planctomycetota bacterium]